MTHFVFFVFVVGFAFSVCPLFSDGDSESPWGLSRVLSHGPMAQLVTVQSFVIFPFIQVE